MGLRLSSPLSSKRVVPVTVVPIDHTASLLLTRINAMRLILRNQPFSTDFIEFVNLSRKTGLILYFDELENLKKSLRHLNTSIIPNTHEVISQNYELHRLFYTVDHTIPSKAQLNVETIAIECLQPLLLHEPHTDVTVPIFARMIRMCQNNLLYHLIPEMKAYLHSDEFHALRQSEIFVIRQVYHQILNTLHPTPPILHPVTPSTPTSSTHSSSPFGLLCQRDQQNQTSKWHSLDRQHSSSSSLFRHNTKTRSSFIACDS